MPSKRTIAVILLFWLVTTGYVVYRDYLPRLTASGPPPVTIDLADEATQAVPVRWSIYRGDRKVGRLVTLTRYDKENDTFKVINDYKQLELDLVRGIKCEIPLLTTELRITRDGDLKEQSLEGNLVASLLSIKIGEGYARIQGTVTAGQLNATCDIRSPFGEFREQLDPVPVPKGQPLNPLQPINRLANLYPGLSWFVELNDPLGEAIGVLVQKILKQKGGISLPQTKREPLFARVLAEPQDLGGGDKPVPCWVIEYKQGDEAVARTWVRLVDGKVMKQEAFRGGETLRIVRDE